MCTAVGVYVLAAQAERAIITAHPFDLSATRVEASRRKTVAAPVYRIVVEADEEAQDLALQRGLTLTVAVDSHMLPAREFDPMVNRFPCGWCEWKAQCMSDGPDYDIALPVIPLEWSVLPA